jgi:hypothetical protein
LGMRDRTDALMLRKTTTGKQRRRERFKLMVPSPNVL